METIKHPIENDAPNKSSSRIVTEVSSILQDVPYLSSPMNRSRIPTSTFRSTCSRKSKRRSVNRNRVGSPERSTVGSLRLNSPYSESIYSLQSLSSARSCTLNKGKSQNRCVILPNEVETLAQFFGQRPMDQSGAAFATDVDDEEYDVSDCADDSTLDSMCVQSVDDAAVSEYISRATKDSALCNRKVSISSPLHCQDREYKEFSDMSEEHGCTRIDFDEAKGVNSKGRGSVYSYGSPVLGTMNSTMQDRSASLNNSSIVGDSSPQIKLPFVEHKVYKANTRGRKKYLGNGIEHLSKSPYMAQQGHTPRRLNNRRVESKRRPCWEP